VVPRILKSRMGGRAFSFQAPLLWKQTPSLLLRLGFPKKKLITFDRLHEICNYKVKMLSYNDPYRNRIGQWLNETSNSKILQLSYSLNSEAREGTYNIIVSVGENQLYHSFKVEKYVLPKFDVTVNVPQEVSIGQEEFDIKLCAKYTYGQPVPGSVIVTVCRPFWRYGITNEMAENLNITAPCHTDSKQSTFRHFTPTRKENKDLIFPWRGVFHLYAQALGTRIKCGRKSKYKMFSFSCVVVVYDTDCSINVGFSNTALLFEQVKAVFYNDTPIPETPVYLFVGERWSARSLQNLTTDSNGVASFSFSTENFDQDIILHKIRIVAFFFPFLFVSVNEGEVSFKLRVSPEMAPDIQIVAYAVLPSKNVIADSSDFSTEKCFSHKVSLEFRTSSGVPGEKNNLQVMALPHSLCGVKAIDKSVLIKAPGTILDADKVTADINHSLQQGCPNLRPMGRFRPRPLLNAGLKMATNLLIRIPSCVRFQGRDYHHNLGDIESQGRVTFYFVFLDTNAPDLPVAPIETVRTFFPETWIWDLVEVGESGSKDVPLIIPDTITTWETEAFCLSSQGFGLAPPQEVKVFQPFFLELTMPYSIIRGEHFELKATVFNYLTSCIMVTVSPTPSSDYTLTPLSGDQYTSCLCANKRKTVSWTMTPTTLGVVNVTVSAEAVHSHVSCDNEVVRVPERGHIDVVTKSLRVKAEGTEMTKTSNWLLYPKGDTLTEETEIQLPENVIKGSARAFVSVLGDILGRALKNLDGLLQMPYGCGEQNMALLAPNIYILQYLKGTQQLTPAIMEKATNFLTSGYQRQLYYKSNEGAYTTFGRGPGNTWLTAFVMRSFAKAQSFIYIDPTKIEESKTWLKSKQQENGCFEKSGKLFNNRMKGGVSDEVTLSVYITAAFLEMNISQNDPVVNKSLACLKESISDLSNTYTTALLAYVFTLAGDMETRAHLLQHLDTVAVKEGETSTSSLSVEISSYVLLAKLSASPTVLDLGYASGIIRWLTSQQNYYGGFSSTQDTVVALQALALYSTLVFSPEGSTTVTVQTPSSQLTFDVNQDNKLLYQEKTMQDVSGKYSLEVKGTACASVQENTTNMVILDIKMLSGFVPDAQSLKRVSYYSYYFQLNRNVACVSICDVMMVLPKDTPINHSLEIIQELPVDNLKPAVVKIYDYYQPSDQAETEYIYPGAAGSKL
uniref:Alpha-2-macroglobulin domain-containing protein n=1 Tax=Amphilophus citrinellus TaxID=61819 RepID=A0A3Q0RXQ3_AMPCI